MSVVPILVRRRRWLMSSFKKAGAISEEKAVTVEEMVEKWWYGPKPLKKQRIAMDLNFLSRRGKVKKTEDEKYYLVVK